MNRIALNGCYYNNNFGDLLLADLMTLHLKRRHGVAVTCVWPPHSSEILAEKGRGLLSCPRVQGAIFGGGGYFVTNEGKYQHRAKLRYSLPARIWHVLRIPYVIVGVGAGPRLEGKGAARVRYVCAQSEAICVRDKESYDVLHQIGVDTQRVEITADLAMGMQRELIPDTEWQNAQTLLNRGPGEVLLGIHLESASQDIVSAQRIADQVAKVARRHKDLRLIVMSDHMLRASDGIVDSLRKASARFTVVPRQNHWTTAALLGQLDSVLTTKLHVGIVAWALGVPPMCYAAHGKTARFYRQIGRPQFHRRFGEDPRVTQDWIELLMKSRSLFGEECKQARGQLPQDANRNYEVIDRVLLASDGQRRRIAPVTGE